MVNPIIIFGARNLGIHALEIFKSHRVEVYGFLDDDKELHGSTIDDVTVLGSTADDGFLKLIGKKCDAFVAIEDAKERKSQVKLLNEKRKVMPVNAIHSNTTISNSAIVSYGLFIDAGVVIGSKTEIKEHGIIHAQVTVGSSVQLAQYVQLGAGSIINDNVEIGQEAFIGTGVTIVSEIKVGKKARIGAGSVVINDVADGQTVFGNPAKPVEL